LRLGPKTFGYRARECNATFAPKPMAVAVCYNGPKAQEMAQNDGVWAS
jgi:hypothetical protein